MPRSATPPTYSAFEAENRVYEERLSAFLADVVADKARHGRFLNTISLLEHMGSQRIMATQSGPAMDEETLKHMAEEARHAFFFKRQANRFSGRDLAYADADMIAPAFARMYFKRLESFIACDVVRDMGAGQDATAVIYLYMSMIIEYRAVWGFRFFQQALNDAGVRLSLKSLEAEEQAHLSHMQDALSRFAAATDDRIHRFVEKERGLFVAMLTAMESALAAEQQAA